MGHWALRVASHQRHGGGHLARTRVLAHALKAAGETVTLVLDDGSEHVHAFLEADEMTYCNLRDLSSNFLSGCVLDGYEIVREELKFWIKNASPIIIFDDFLDPPAGVNLVVNGAPHLSGDELDGIPALLGGRYAVIDPRYAALPNRDRRKPVSHVLVSLGRLDPDNLTSKVVDAILALGSSISITVAIPANSPHRTEIESRIAVLGDRGKIVFDAPDLLALLAQSDLVIGAGGVSMLERMAAGVPSITIAIIDNQKFFVEGAAKLDGTIAATANSEKFDELRFSETLRAVLCDGALRAFVSARSRELIDGRGGERVAEALIGHKIGTHRPKVTSTP